VAVYRDVRGDARGHPFYGACCKWLPRRRFVPWVYAFFIANLVAFALVTRALPDSVWLARVFYVWISVFNLFVVSVAWSLMADVFRPEQAKRLFAIIAAGASAGGLTGPVLGGWLVGHIGLTGLMLLSAALLAATLPGVGYLFAWRRRYGAAARQRDSFGGGPRATGRRRTLGWSVPGPPFPVPHRYQPVRDPAGHIEHVPLLRAGTTGGGHLPLACAADTGIQRARRHRAGADDPRADFLFRTRGAALRRDRPADRRAAGRDRRLPATGDVAHVRRARGRHDRATRGEYAMLRPGREMLFTVVDPETKYKAKNVIDTAIYRAGDAVSAWVKTAIDALSGHPATVALAGAVLAIVWGWLGWWLGRQHEGQLTELTPRNPHRLYSPGPDRQPIIARRSGSCARFGL
jgi:AAA family ATP:ADP antiporter